MSDVLELLKKLINGEDTCDINHLAWMAADRIEQLERENCVLVAERDELAAHSKELRDEIAGIINDSVGVSGYHMNGDVASWDEFEIIEMLDRPPQTRLSEKEEPFPDCDTCGKSMSYMPWHYSKENNRHLHACDECWPESNPLSILAEVRAKQAEESFLVGANWWAQCELDGELWHEEDEAAKQHAQQIRNGKDG